MIPKQRPNDRWIWVVLVCTLQLLVALGLISWGLSIFEQKAVLALRQQMLDELSLHAEQLSRSIQQHLHRRKSNSTEEIANYLLSRQENSADLIALIDPTNLRIHALIQGGTLQPISTHHDNLTNMVCRSLTATELTRVSQIFQNPLIIQRDGLTSLNGTEHLVSLRRLHDLDIILLVARAGDSATAQLQAWLPTAKRVVFTTALLVGFLVIFLNTSILQKFDAEINRIYCQLTDALLKRTRELNNTQNGVIFGLAKLAESRDNDTGDHLERIRGYVTLLVEELRGEFSQIDDDYIRNISLASSLHDIGKVGIPDAILLKPGRLTETERRIMEFHTIIGGECIQAIQRRLGDDHFLAMAYDIVIAHHERWDGKGYPHRLAGEQIPLAARILAVADVYDALTSKRPYKAAMSHEKSCQIIREGSGTQFDPQVVAAFSRRTDDFRRLMERGRVVDDDSVIPAIARLQQILAEPQHETSLLTTA